MEKLIPELQRLLPNPAQIHVGTGRRHLDVAKALGFSMEKVYFSDLWGSPESLKKIAGKKIIVLADNTNIVYEKFLTIKHLARIISNIIAELPHNALICSGRPVLVRLGKEPEGYVNPELSTLYTLWKTIQSKLNSKFPA